MEEPGQRELEVEKKKKTIHEKDALSSNSQGALERGELGGGEVESCRFGCTTVFWRAVGGKFFFPGNNAEMITKKVD